jgi:competence protein ComEC
MERVMVTGWRAVLVGVVCSVAALMHARAASAAGTLEIYFIDVEGGQATLVVTPEKRSLLIDAGWASDGKGFKPGDPAKARDANRIVAAARDAGVSQIDYLLITHFHTDHFGGVSELAQLMPIRGFVDHGAPHPRASETSQDTRDAFALYAAIRGKDGARHLEPRPGDRLPLNDLDVTVVSSGGAILSAPLPGAGAGAGTANSACPKSPIPAGDPDENPRSTGVLVRHGKFSFLDVGDLSGQPLLDLVCPKNLVGRVDAYLTAHHGGADAAEPATLAAFQPRVVMINNAPRKGGQRAMFEVLHRASGIENVWQLHSSTDARDLNYPAEYIANVDDSGAHWIKLVADEDGSFRVFNARTKQWKQYPAR